MTETDREEDGRDLGGPMLQPELLAGFRPRATDVLITTVPKCGTTWMQQILHQLRTGGDDAYGTIYEVVPWLEAPVQGGSVEERLELYESQPDPRIFKTHCTPDRTPGIDVVRLVMTFRDPRDACVSMFHHQVGLAESSRKRHGFTPPATMDEHLDAWIADDDWCGPVRAWWAERHRPNLLWLRYEDLVEDLSAALDRIATFLGWPLSEARRTRVLERCSFDWMRRNHDRFVRLRTEDEPIFAPGRFIRKGQPGDWRNHFTPDQAERLLEHVRRELPGGWLERLGYAA